MVGLVLFGIGGAFTSGACVTVRFGFRIVGRRE